MIFVDQAEVSAQEQQRFDRSLEQIERFVEDQLLVLRRRLAAETKSLGAAEERRDAALGSDAQGDAEKRMRAVQKADRRAGSLKFSGWRSATIRNTVSGATVPISAATGRPK